MLLGTSPVNGFPSKAFKRGQTKGRKLWMVLETVNEMVNNIGPLVF